MSAVLPWLAVAVPLAVALGVGFVRRGAGWAALAAAGVTLLLVLVAGAGDPLALGLAGLVAAAAMLAARPGMAAGEAVRLLAMLGALELAALAESMLLGWVGIAVAVLVAVVRGRGFGAWRALRVVVPALGLVLAGAVVGAGSGGRASLGHALLLAGLVGCAGLVPVQGWRRIAGRGAAGAMLPALSAVALGMLLRARAAAGAAGEGLDPAGPLLAVGVASLGWAAIGLWRGRMDEAGLFHAGLAACAFGVGGAQADAAGLVLLAVAALAVPAGGALGLWVLALLPPFASFGAGLAVVGAAADVSLGLAAGVAGLATLGAAGLARVAMGAALGAGWAPAAIGVRPAVVAVLALLAGMVPAVGGWFDLIAGVVR